MGIPEIYITMMVGFISGATCGVMGMMFYIRHKYNKGDTKTE